MGKRFLIWDNPRDALVNLVYFLMILGGVNIFSASFVAAADMFGNGYHYLIRYAIYGAIGLGLMHWVGRKWDYHQFFRVDQLLCVGCTVLLIAVDIFGKATKGAQRWLILGPFSFQPSEFVKLAVILLGAHFLGRVMEQGKTPHLHRKDTCQAFLEAAFMSFLVLIQPDMGTASIILTLMIVLYLLAGLPWKEFGILVGVLLGGAVAAVIQAPYRLNRMRIWLTPELDPQGNGYQAVQAKMAIGSGGIFGEPFGMGTSKFFYLPEAHTDFAFAIFCQEWGYIGALFLIACFVIMAWAMVTIAMNTKDRRGYMLVAGSTLFLIGQAAANMAMVTGLFPVIGVPLMFISYGGTSLIANMFTLGLVVAVSRNESTRETMEERIAAGLPPTEENRLRVVSSNRNRRPF